MINPLLLPEIRLMLEENDDDSLRELVNGLHPASVAEFTEGLDIAQTWRVLDYASLERQAQILPYFPFQRQVELLHAIDLEHTSGLIERMASDDRVGLLKRLAPGLVARLLPLVPEKERKDIEQLLAYHRGTAGSLMTTQFAWLPDDVSAAQALQRLREQAPKTETIYLVFVIDGEHHLLGTVSLRELVMAPPDARVSQLMKRDVVAVNVNEDRGSVARKLGRYDVLALPVIDAGNRLLGMVTYDDVMDVVVQRATEALYRQGAVEPIAENYLEASFFRVWYKRAGWLSCLFLAELFTFTMLAHFEHEIEAVVALSLFVPLCISTGGNSGSQAATLVTRAMALGQIAPKDARRVIVHEVGMGLALGLALGTIGFFRAAMTPASVLGGVNRWDIAIVIAQAVAAICLWGTIVGSILPLIFKRLGFDPGFASSPFVATFVDVTGIFIYFTIARIYIL